jgi:hypothetical protein
MRAFCLFLVAGCSFSSPQVGGGDGMPPTEGGGNEKMTADAESCFGPATGNFTICLGPGYTNPFPTSAYDVQAMSSFDTGEDCTFTQPQDSGLPPLCVKAATNITISSRLGTKGAPPLVLLATGDIMIAQNGSIDVASHRGVGDGAGTVNCSAGQKAGGSDNNGGGGGAGASYGTIAGNGGTGAGGGGSAGTADPATSPPPPGLNGACDAGDGGSGGNGGGTNGNGGGAVYLVAGGTISISGLINASGAGARGGPKPKGGGGGGGAGGMIVLYGHDVTFGSMAVLVANGGGGGGGATMGTDGGAGSDPDPSMPTLVGKGGLKGGPSAGAGGNGAFGTTAAETGDSANDGGGGGGGGAGFIRILSGQPTTGAKAVSPPAITN